MWAVVIYPLFFLVYPVEVQEFTVVQLIQGLKKKSDVPKSVTVVLAVLVFPKNII